jgi:hypothetical protein
MTPSSWAFQIGEVFTLAVGDCMGGVEFKVVSRDFAHGLRTYLLHSQDPGYPGLTRVETERMLQAMREMDRILGEVDR